MLDRYDSARAVVDAVARPAASILLVAALTFTAVGCGATLPNPTVSPQVHEARDVLATWNQMRLQVRALVQPMCGEIEQAADSIAGSTDDRRVRQAALQWKLDGVPALREALFRTDPFAALADTWVLLDQMADYFETGPGAGALGPARSTAVEACRRLERDLTAVAASATASGDVGRAREQARKWAADHPIRSSIASRPTLNRALERDDPTAALSTGDAVGLLLAMADDMAKRLDIYSDQLFRQARWEADRYTADLIVKLSADQVVPLADRAVGSAQRAEATVDRLAPGIERAATVASDVPSLLDSQRTAAMRQLHGEMTQALDFIRNERVAAMGQVTVERGAAIDQLHETLAVERKQLTADLDGLSDRVVDRLVHRLAWLVAAVLAVVFLAVIVGLLLVRRLFFRRPLELRRPA